MSCVTAGESKGPGWLEPRKGDDSRRQEKKLNGWVEFSIAVPIATVKVLKDKKLICFWCSLPLKRNQHLEMHLGEDLTIVAPFYLGIDWVQHYHGLVGILWFSLEVVHLVWYLWSLWWSLIHGSKQEWSLRSTQNVAIEAMHTILAKPE